MGKEQERVTIGQRRNLRKLLQSLGKMIEDINTELGDHNHEGPYSEVLNKVEFSLNTAVADVEAALEPE